MAVILMYVLNGPLTPPGTGAGGSSVSQKSGQVGLSRKLKSLAAFTPITKPSQPKVRFLNAHTGCRH